MAGVPRVVSVTLLPANTCAVSGMEKLVTGTITVTVISPRSPEPSAA